MATKGGVSARLRWAAANWKLWLGLLAGIVLGYLFTRLLTPPAPKQGGEPATQAAATEEKQTWWTCAMHPQIRLTKPGRCPICHMELILLATQEHLGGLPQLKLSPEAIKLLDVETSLVERKSVAAEVRMVGKIAYDETRLKSITAWVGGRLDKMFVDYTGVPVRKGDHMLMLYSPELISGQEELIQAAKAASEASGGEAVRQMAQATADAAREKLRLWGLTAEQIAQIETSGKAADRVTIYSPIGGIVIRKSAQEGSYVTIGQEIYAIADLTEVWAILDAYEADLMWVRYGQKVEFTTVSYPGVTFTGTIAFIDPVLNADTRTVRVRVNVPNSDGRLKPEMFVEAVVRAQVAAGGKVMAADLAGKWICPMHPSVVKDRSGTCDICGMPLVRTESLGYVSPQEGAAPPLVIPVSAALVTGKRAVVYVRTGDGETLTFTGREVTLGPRAGDYYLVAGGLSEGERVVTRGNFMIDSALQIQAKPSMMSPPSPASAPAGPTTQPVAGVAAVSGEFLSQLQKVFDGYLAAGGALAGDDHAKAVAAAGQAAKALAAVDMTLLSGEEHVRWMASADQLRAALADLAASKDIQTARKAFATLSEQMAALAARYGPMGEGTVYRMHCPMAFDGRGADWLQLEAAIRNPYFGAAMPQCGEVVAVIGQKADGAPGGGEHRHE